MVTPTDHNVGIQPARRRWFGEGLRVAAAAVLGAAVVLAILVAIVGRDRGAGGSALGNDGTGTDATAQAENGDANEVRPSQDEEQAAEEQPNAAGPEGITPCPDGERVEVCDAVAFIEGFKGATFERFPTVNFLDNEAFDEFILDDFDAESAELVDYGDVVRSLGLIDPDVDLAEALRTSLEVGVVGGYHTETEELNVLGIDIDLYTRSVMVHELTHAWDDQHYELARPELDDQDDEAASGFLQLVEGSAMLVERAWRASLSDDQRAELEELELAAVSPQDLTILFAIPEFILQTQISPYVDGAAFVQSVYDDGGIDAVADLFDDPPVTTEQVLHPEAYVSRELPIEVSEPAVGFAAIGEPISSGTIGELTLDLWLGQNAGDGWGGDAFVSWRTADAVCTAVHLVGDTDDDTDEIMAAASAWADQSAGRSAQRAAGVVRIRGCI